MKINHLKRYLIGIVMTAFLALLVGNAFGANAASDNASRDFSDGDGKYANSYMVVSPYWQVEGGVSYTFIAVSHSSLSGMASQIGVTINAITSAGTAYDTAESFTISAGATQRVFIVPTNHSTINSTNISSAVFLSGTTNYTYGHLRINPQTSHPELKYVGSKPRQSADIGGGFRDTTMLAYWGSIIVEANTTGFAMEFIGDMNDSTSLPSGYLYHQSATSIGASGVNLH